MSNLGENNIPVIIKPAAYLKTSMFIRKDNKLYEHELVFMNLDKLSLESILQFLPNIKHVYKHGGKTQPAEDTELITGGDTCENNTKTLGGYSHLNNILNPEYFKDLENTATATDVTAGIPNLDENVLVDEHVNCDILSSLLVN